MIDNYIGVIHLHASVMLTYGKQSLYNLSGVT